MITRKHFGLNYSGNDPSQPPPLCFTSPHANRAIRTQGRMRRGGDVPLAPPQMRLMADLTDPSTWRRPYRFT